MTEYIARRRRSQLTVGCATRATLPPPRCQPAERILHPPWGMTEETAQLRRDLADTRDRVSDDIKELRNRAKQRLDLAHVVREHPWSALGAAVALGAIIGGSGADEKMASAASGAVTGTFEQLRSRAARNERSPEVVQEHHTKPGIGARIAGMVGVTLATTLDRVIDEMRVASRDWGTRMSASRRPATTVAAPVAAAVVARVERTVAPDRAVDAVPVPDEIAPAELGLRADAVEAIGGGTHEPPLEPGAGELGARWS